MKDILNRIKKDKKSLSLAIIAGLMLLMLVTSATYAYFRAKDANERNTPIRVISGTTDNLSFKINKDIMIHANLGNFSEYDGNQKDDATATAILSANNTTNEASAKYNIYFVIEDNDLIYTTAKYDDNNLISEVKPELLLKVIDPNNNEVTKITGLNYKSVVDNKGNTQSGFDITMREGSFLIASDYDICATSTSTTQNWKIEVMLVNLNEDQSRNGGSTVAGKIYITQDKLNSYKLMEINSMSTTSTYESINSTLSFIPGTSDNVTYYYGIKKQDEVAVINELEDEDIEGITFVSSDKSSYEFKNLDANTNYKLYAYSKDEYGFKSNVYSTIEKTNEYNKAKIDDISFTTGLYNINVTGVTVTLGDREIEEYCYYINNTTMTDFVCKSVDESGYNTYEFDNLVDTSTYEVSVKVKDGKGVYSNIFKKSIDTKPYVLPSVKSASYTSTYNSATITAIANEDSTNDVTGFLYSKDKETGYTNNSLITGLEENKTTTIYIKAVDSKGRESNPPYELSVTTDEYVLPSIAVDGVNVSVTENSITLSVTPTIGKYASSIEEYCYSKDNGSNYTCIASDSKTFDSLTSGVKFYLAIKIRDNNNRWSSEWKSSDSTKPAITNFYIGGSTNPENTITTQTSLYLEYSGSDVEKYCIQTSNTTEGCVWNNVSTSPMNISYTITGGYGEKELFAFLKTESGRISSSKSDSIIYREMTIPEKCDGKTLSNCITQVVYTGTDGVNNIYKHDGQGTHQGVSQEACWIESGVTKCENSYRFSGASDVVNNYVCFGGTCDDSGTSENLYRIIGVFDNQVKLIKATKATSALLGTENAYYSDDKYSWCTRRPNSCSSNHWGLYSLLNKNNFNSGYVPGGSVNKTYGFLATIGETWASLIVNHTWKAEIAEISSIRGVTGVRNVYNNEIRTSTSTYDYTNKVALMYVSDYMYAADPTDESKPWSDLMGSNLDKTKSFESVIDNNWMYNNTSEWMLTPCSDGELVFALLLGGYIYFYSSATSLFVRPVFYLDPTVPLASNSGDGSKTNPFRLAVS